VSIDQQFVEFVIKSLVTKPDAVQIERRIDEKGVLLELTVDPEDLGRVIGKRGATAQSVRTLLRALGTKNDARYNLKIVDNGLNANYSGDTASSESTEKTTNADSRDTPPAPTTESKNDAWASSDNETSDDGESSGKDVDDQEDNRDDAVAKTRRELRDLDDLDV
jgi:predicted RNA-binding protein YlqC (UPF0109 family)